MKSQFKKYLDNLFEKEGLDVPGFMFNDPRSYGSRLKFYGRKLTDEMKEEIEKIPEVLKVGYANTEGSWCKGDTIHLNCRLSEVKIYNDEPIFYERKSNKEEIVQHEFTMEKMITDNFNKAYIKLFVDKADGNIDGETTQDLLVLLGMDEQMLKQLIMTYDFGIVCEFFANRVEMEESKFKKKWKS